MNRHERKAYAKLGDCPRILDELEREIREQGFSGSADVPKLVYLTFITGVLDRPVSLLLQGPSGVGKSYSLRAGQQFIPKTAYEQFEGMSEKALIYLKGLDLKHKHLVISEAAGLAKAEGRKFLRQLLSEDIARYVTVQKTSNGLAGVELPPLEGPMGLVMTTTATEIHSEDASRMLSVNIVESPEQIAEALMAQALGKKVNAEALDTEPWFELYESVKAGPKDVVIPYAKVLVLKLPTTHDRIKRDFPQIQSLIKASALLHQGVRERDENGNVIASLDDYAQVRQLVNGPISEGLGRAVADNVRAVVEGVQTLQREAFMESASISQTRLARHLGRDPSAVSRSVTKASALGYLRNDNFGQGREASLKLGDRELPSESVLPEPEALVENCHHEERGSVAELVVA